MATVRHLGLLPRGIMPVHLSESDPIPSEAAHIDKDDLVALIWRVKSFRWTNAPTLGVKMQVMPGAQYPSNFEAQQIPVNIQQEDIRALVFDRNEIKPIASESNLVCIAKAYWAAKGGSISVVETSGWIEGEEQEGATERWRYSAEMSGYYTPALSLKNSAVSANIFEKNDQYYAVCKFEGLFVTFEGSLQIEINEGGGYSPYTSLNNSGQCVVGPIAGNYDGTNPYHHEGTIVLQYDGRSVSIPYYYTNEFVFDSFGNPLFNAFVSLNDHSINIRTSNDSSFGTDVFGSIILTADEYWPYDPGDGGGPIYDSATGAQLRPFP